MPARPPARTGTAAFDRTAAARTLLGYFYPIHYRAGIRVEDALRGGTLSRHQVAVLWHIHSMGEEGRAMRRKDIERALRTWFEISPAAITKAIRGMADAPLKLVVQVEDPRSGREKTVRLTPKGEKHIAAMIARATALIEEIMAEMDAGTVRDGTAFFEAITRAMDRMDAAEDVRGA